ncbi:hypothetical protein [Maribacter sp. 2210JD10-5]
MKNKRTFLASVALGIFLFAMAAPIISIDKGDISVKKMNLGKRI